MVTLSKQRNYILGISAYYHDSAAALIVDDEIIAAAHEERFTRKKHDERFPVNAIQYCLDEAGISFENVSHVVFYDKPMLKFERILETYLIYAPKGIKLFIMSAVLWIKEKLFMRNLLIKELTALGFSKDSCKLLFTKHHLSHAASAFFPSPFNEAVILTIDGVGEWATMTIAKGEAGTIKMLKELRFPNSVGLLYSAFTYFLGFKVNSGEYKLMGLGPYGNEEAEETLRYCNVIKDKLVTIHDDGSIVLNQAYFHYTVGLKMIDDEAWEKLFGFPKRDPGDEFSQHHMNLAMAIQMVTEEIVLKMASHAKEITGSHNICLAGGVALNCVSNSKILRSDTFKNMWIQPASGDAGGALGAALAVNYMYLNNQRSISVGDSMKGSYLGPSFTDDDVYCNLKQFKSSYRTFSEFEKLTDEVAQLIAEGNVIGWFQGRMEWGPRSLGNRSILGDPRSAAMQKHINLKIKYRESFRPFAGSILEEDASEFFDIGCPAPYMLLTADVVPERRNPRPANYATLSLLGKLYHVRSDIPAVTHLDYSCRLQTVNRDKNPKFYDLISAFKRLTGFGIVINTSFNVRGEPIVCTPSDAYRCFMNTEMDYLVVGNKLFAKKDQPPFPKADYGKEAYALD